MNDIELEDVRIKSTHDRYEATLDNLNAKSAEINKKAQALYDLVHKERQQHHRTWSFETRTSTGLDKLFTLIKGYVSKPD